MSDEIDWASAHSDAYHPESRDTCDHCQEMIRHFGPMPSIAEIQALARGRRAQKASVKAAIPDALRWEVWERDNFTCQHCGSRKYLSVDHIIPESRGGTLEIENLQTLCRKCNSSKGARLIQ